MTLGRWSRECGCQRLLSQIPIFLRYHLAPLCSLMVTKIGIGYSLCIGIHPDFPVLKPNDPGAVLEQQLSGMARNDEDFRLVDEIMQTLVRFVMKAFISRCQPLVHDENLRLDHSRY